MAFALAASASQTSEAAQEIAEGPVQRVGEGRSSSGALHWDLDQLSADGAFPSLSEATAALGPDTHVDHGLVAGFAIHAASSFSNSAMGS